MGRSWLGLGLACVLTTGALVAACGTSGDGSIFGEGPGGADGSVGDESTLPPNFTDDGGTSDGSSSGCQKKTCAQLGVNCGPQGDGCGGSIDCGTCKAPETCGGGGVASQCGGNSGCVPKTCKDLGVNCGQQADG